MANGHTYIFDCIPQDLRLYKKLSNIRCIDGTKYVTVIAHFLGEKSYRGIVLSKTSGIRNLKVTTVLDFLNNEELLYDYFTSSNKVIRHEKKKRVSFYKT